MDGLQGNAVNQAKDTRSHINLFVILVASIAAVAGILFGFDTGVISGAILYIQREFQLSATLEGVVVSSVLIGALIGAALGGRFADYFGRRSLLIITAIVFFLSTLASAFVESIDTLILTRIFVGFAIGIASFTAPLYISEIAPPKYRGMLVSLNQLAITIGIMLAYVVDTIYSQHADAWRWMLGMGVVPAFILLVGMLFLPKSPRWLILRKRHLQAQKTLAKIRGTDDVNQEIESIKNSLSEKKSFKLLFKKWLRPALVIGLGLAFFQQCTGINTIIYYAPTIFKFAGFESNTVAILATSGVGLVNVLFTIIALPLIDRWGRRPLLLMGVTGMTLSLLILSIAFALDAQAVFLKWIALGSMVLYIACFAMSLGPIMWLIIAEIFPLEIRGLGSSIAVSASWAFNGIVALTFLILIEKMGSSGTFLLYGLLSVIGIFFVYKMVPETKGVSLEKIEENLRAGLPARELGKG